MKGIIVTAIVVTGALAGVTLHAYHASANTPTTVRVTLRDYRVALVQRHLPVGKPITFLVSNQGQHTHEFVLEAANAVDKALRFNGTTYEADEIKPGTTRKVTWTLPGPGRYKLACHIDHHYQMGMKALFTASNP